MILNLMSTYNIHHMDAVFLLITLNMYFTCWETELTKETVEQCLVPSLVNLDQTSSIVFVL